MERRLEQAEQGLKQATRRARMWGAVAFVVVAGTLTVFVMPTRPAEAQRVKVAVLQRLEALEDLVADLLVLTAPLSFDGTDLCVTGAQPVRRQWHGKHRHPERRGQPHRGVQRAAVSARPE